MLVGVAKKQIAQFFQWVWADTPSANFQFGGVHDGFAGRQNVDRNGKTGFRLGSPGFSLPSCHEGGTDQHVRQLPVSNYLLICRPRSGDLAPRTASDFSPVVNDRAVSKLGRLGRGLPCQSTNC